MTTTLWKDLPDDVFTDIFSWLPVKTLVRLRSVCKSWYALITHPTFITKHLDNAYLLYNNNNAYLQYLTIDFYGQEMWCLVYEHLHFHALELIMPFTYRSGALSLIGAVNGLVCLSNLADFGRTLFLWNPSIRKFKTLSAFSSTIIPQFKFSPNYVVHGFGFHPQTNDYKIVRILYFQHVNRRFVLNSLPVVEVYTLSTDSWKRIHTHVPCYSFNPEVNAFIHGSAHWFASKSVEDKRRRDMIMSFNFGGEVFGEMMLPNYDIVGEEMVDFTLAVLKESHSLCVCFWGNRHCVVWVMKEYGVAESWTKQFTVALPQRRILRPLCFTKNNELLLIMWNGKMVSYDLESSHFKDLGICKAKFSSIVFPFIESLILLSE